MMPESLNDDKNINVIVVINMTKNAINNKMLFVIITGRTKYIQNPKARINMIQRPIFIGRSDLGPVMSNPLRQKRCFEGQS